MIRSNSWSGSRASAWASAKAPSELSDEERNSLRKSKAEILKQQDRYDRMPSEAREREVDELILNDLARSEVPPFEKWYLRRRAQQAMLPFDAESGVRAVS